MMSEAFRAAVAGAAACLGESTKMHMMDHLGGRGGGRRVGDGTHGASSSGGIRSTDVSTTVDPLSYFQSIDSGPTHDRMVAKGWCSRAAAHPELNRYCDTVCLC